MKLLIVDDEVDALSGMELYFSAKGHEVLTAQGGHEALALVKACRPQVMLLDLKMKGLSGFEIMDKVQELDPALKTIVITGMSQDNLETECSQRGALKVLHKPIKLEELDEIVRKLGNGG